MNISFIAFAVMTGFVTLFLLAMFLVDMSGKPADVPKSDTAKPEDENPFKSVD